MAHGDTLEVEILVSRECGAAFAESDNDSIDALLREAIEGDGWEPVMEQLVAPVRKLIAESESFEGVRPLANDSARIARYGHRYPQLYPCSW